MDFNNLDELLELLDCGEEVNQRTVELTKKLGNCGSDYLMKMEEGKGDLSVEERRRLNFIESVVLMMSCVYVASAACCASIGKDPQTTSGTLALKELEERIYRSISFWMSKHIKLKGAKRPEDLWNL